MTLTLKPIAELRPNTVTLGKGSAELKNFKVQTKDNTLMIDHPTAAKNNRARIKQHHQDSGEVMVTQCIEYKRTKQTSPL